MVMTIDDFKPRLEAYLTQQAGTPVSVEDMQPLAGGASRDSRVLMVTIGGKQEKLVLRRDLPTTMVESALTRVQEFRLMRAAYESGVKVARVRWLCEDPAVLGQPFFIMDYVEGISIGRKVIQMPELARAREGLPDQMAEQLALIHRIDPATHDLDFLPRPRDGLSPAQSAIAQTYEILDSLGIHNPAFEFALRWAQQNTPTGGDETFLHGDFRVGNLLVDADGLAAVIDWEFGHIGDPLEEVGYPCMRDWRFGNDHLHMGGLCPRERFIRAYESYSGRTVDHRAVDWWEIVGNIRWGVICLAQAARHLSGDDPNVEFASLGRRSAEMQLEALRLIEKAGL
jgi:aminoglycoside phosphotransferase (APT) family kinase protein